MRVLVVHSRYRSVSGEEAVVERELALLNDAGHDARLLEFSNDRGPRSLVDIALAPYNPAAAGRLLREIERHRPEVVHVHNTWFAASPSVMSAARSVGVAVVATLHNYRSVCPAATLVRDGSPCTDCFDRPPWPAIRYRCVNDSVLQSVIGATVVGVRRRGERRSTLADLYIAPSRRLADRVIEGGLPPERVEVLAHFAPDSTMSKGPSDGGAGPTRPSERSVVLYAGRLSAEKGVSQLVTAWEQGTGRPPGSKLVIAGEGPLEADLRARAVPDVEFLGRVPADGVDALMRDARFVVVPSVWDEPFGLVYLEAMARGVGVLSSDMGAAPELLAGGGGWLVPPGDVATLATRMVELLADTDAARDSVDTAGRRGRATFEAHYSPARHLARLLELYRTAAFGV